MKTLDRKTVLITGGARGMGLEMARQFSAAGAAVVIADLDGAAATTAAGELGPRAGCVTLDVTDLESIAAARARIRSEHGRVDVLINNAGVVFGGPFLEVPIERHQATFRVNVDGVVAVTHAFLGDLIDAPEGHLVNMASASGFLGLPFGSTYAASKWAVIGFSESIRMEMLRLGHRHVGVTTVCPSYVATGMFEGVRPPLLTPLLTPERMAKLVVKAVRRRQVAVLEPWMVKVTPAIMALLPRSISDRVSDLFGASTSMVTWTGRENKR